MSNNLGKLYLIPTRLGDNPPLEVLPISVKKIIERIDYYIVENEKSARAFIKKVHSRKSQSSLNLFKLNKFTDVLDLPKFLEPCANGEDVGLLSEAGCPGIADPGADIVNIAHQKDIKVIPLVGPSSILLAMMASGMNGQNFAFNGYLPIDIQDKRKELKRLERLSFDNNQSQIFIETPYRNNKMLEDLCNILDQNTKICVATDITLSSEFIKTRTAIEWQKNIVDLHKRPTIFIIHKY
ncbi:SAM-dependent methyltransferase [Yeosuana sp. MJ-SS3]|jgi:16S rRNA (cytidine1402-2'-O)-methyltransferase|uniref:SAM-dependent methyltransferase n=1 Tax=Gilvirhabdus luticola TaxID=3079858 RepID=A0ABU3UB73_9FLAO|nr:SAM-dependent methyltransferase [Yeosuana sp. MJ-SS3]MDU8887325.1 SAM-dependent methyltransferase [Yeosuana sp. MJ-SS3]